MATQIKNYLLCGGDEIHYFDLSPYFYNWWANVSGSLPTGISELQDSDTGSTVGFAVDFSSLQSGVNTVTIEGFENTIGGDSLGLFTLVFNKTECTTEQELCCENAVTIRWLGVEGGIKQWVFGGVREFDIKVGDAITFKNSNFQQQYAERKNVYMGIRLTSDFITKEQSDFLDELKYSIQAWQWDGTTANPILLVNDSFKKYGSRDKFFDVAIQYIVAKQIQIQTQ